MNVFFAIAFGFFLLPVAARSEAIIDYFPLSIKDVTMGDFRVVESSKPSPVPCIDKSGADSQILPKGCIWTVKRLKPLESEMNCEASYKVYVPKKMCALPVGTKMKLELMPTSLRPTVRKVS